MNMHKGLTHFSENGKARMVNIADKQITQRYARAVGTIEMKRQTLDAIEHGSSRKGDVLGIARVAGIMATKKTSELIPLCHNISIAEAALDFQIDRENNRIHAVCEIWGSARSGFEMEALTGVTVSLLTIYDMAKGIDKSMKIGEIFLAEKKGGKSGHYKKELEP